MESYDVVRQIISNALQNLFLCGIWAFNMFAFLSNFVKTLDTKSVDKKDRTLKIILLTFCLIMVGVSFGMVIHFFKRI